jgi:hypothetical protein
MKYVLATLIAFTLTSSSFAAPVINNEKFRTLTPEQKREVIENKAGQVKSMSPGERHQAIRDLKAQNPEAARKLEERYRLK